MSPHSRMDCTIAFLDDEMSGLSPLFPRNSTFASYEPAQTFGPSIQVGFHGKSGSSHLRSRHLRPARRLRNMAGITLPSRASRSDKNTQRREEHALKTCIGGETTAREAATKALMPKVDFAESHQQVRYRSHM